MKNQIINNLLHTSIFVSFVSSFLSILPTLSFDENISINNVFLIFFGTLFIYNIDHFNDIKSDITTNPKRTKFIINHKRPLLLIILISGILSLYLCLSIGINQTLILTPVFFLGIFHRQLKNYRLFSLFYITVSWIVVVVIFPLYKVSDFNSNYLYITLIFGFTFLANAFVFMAGDFKVEKKYSPIYISKIFTSAGFICALISPSEIKHLIMIPALTFIALIYYKPNERYKLLILDGALLAGGILSFVIKQFRG